MLTKIKQRLSEEKGFTLIELLVVVLIIGILAAIALPVFLGQQKKGQDSSAKSDARNMVSQVESCATDFAGDYTNCGTPSNTGLSVGTGPGQVAVSSPTTNGYTVTAKSKSGGDFVITKSVTSTGVSTIARTCSKPNEGSCPANGQW